MSDPLFPFPIQLKLTKTAHQPETVNYLAWEPSSGTDNGLRYQVGTTGDSIKHTTSTVVFDQAFAQAPLAYTDMQTTDGGDTASLRTVQVTGSDLQIMVEEEQSKDSEINHITEQAGFILLLNQ